MDDTKQIGEAIDAWADLGPTRPLRSSEPPMPNSPPAAIMAVVGELGLRYPPRAAVDVDAHAARIALLARDCADMDPRFLRMAADEWAKREPFLPRACELRENTLAIARRFVPRLPAPQRPPAEPKPPAPPLSDDEIARLPAWLVPMGVKLGEISPEQVKATLERNERRG